MCRICLRDGTSNCPLHGKFTGVGRGEARPRPGTAMDAAPSKKPAAKEAAKEAVVDKVVDEVSEKAKEKLKES